MIQLIGSVALMVAVVGGCITWSWRAGLRERFNRGGSDGHRPV